MLLPQQEVDHGVFWSEYYMIPRRDGIILGGTHEHGVESLDPDPAAARRILDAHQGLFDAMR